jgi:DNA polymerase-1
MSDTTEKKLFLLDGHALVYRAHFAFISRPLINSKGLDTSAITGFVRSLWDIIRNQKPTHIAVAFDPKGGTFRNEVFPEYKANREAQPEPISIAFPYIKEIVRGFNIPIITVDNYEADDTIGTIAKQAEKEGFKVYMVTPDKDYAQLVSENIFMYKPARMGNGIEILGVPEVLEKWEIERVEQVIDILGMQGDAVDNIPGLPGIGKKTAIKLLKQFGSMEGLLANTDQLKGKQKEKVEMYAEQGLLSKRLATIDINVPIQFNADNYTMDEPNKEVLAEIFKDLEFRRLATQILGEEAAPTPASDGQMNLFGGAATAAPVRKKKVAPAAHSVADHNIHSIEHDYKLMDTPDLRKELIDLLSKQTSITFDTETTGIDANEAELVGMSFAVKTKEAYYVPVPADQNEAKAIVAEFKAIFENEAIEKIGQNLKYDALMLKWYGVEVKGKYIDTMIMHYLLEPELRHGMDYLSETYLSYQPVKIESLIGKKGKNQLSMRDIPVEKVVEYASEDADVTLQLKEYLAPELAKEGFQELYDKVEEPMIKALVQLEYNGIKLDSQFLHDYSKEFDAELKQLEKDIYDIAGSPFNIASPKQVGVILFERLEVPYRWKKTPSGQYKTGEEILTELAPKTPIIEKILRFRGLTKLKSTYIDALPNMVNPRTGRIHSSFNQALAATGRLSSSNPNLQNIPVRTPEGAKVREAFVPRDENYVILAADYSQIELRLIAEISGDEAMLEAFQKGQDIHTATAARVFGVPLEEVTREQRGRAKTVNFAVVYGAGATNLSKQLDISRKEASELIQNYFAQFNGLKTWMDKVVEQAREDGYVTTMMGRRRQLRDINSKNGMLRSHAERNAVNTPVQGTAADMIKLAMVEVHKFLMEGDYKTKMVLQVHDELVFDAHKDELEELKPIIEEKMKNALPNLKVPILVGMDEGANWLEAH